jgi:hypothetical protein
MEKITERRHDASPVSFSTKKRNILLKISLPVTHAAIPATLSIHMDPEIGPQPDRSQDAQNYAYVLEERSTPK